MYIIHAGRDGVSDLQWWPSSTSTFGAATQGGTIEVKLKTALCNFTSVLRADTCA